MKPYEQAALDGGDPLYMPNTSQSRDIWYWRAPRPAVKAGYKPARVTLPGREGDGKDQDRAVMARELTRDALRFAEGHAVGPQKGTWGLLIHRYLADEFSPFQEVKGNTKATYRHEADYWREAIGAVLVADTDLTFIKRLEKLMKEKGRSDHFISTRFGALRRVANYGIALRMKDAGEVAQILGVTRFKGGLARTVNPTEAQLLAVVKAADDAGDNLFSLSILLQWWLSLRAIDVRGEFIPADASVGGIRRKGMVWRDGLTWDMISADLTVITKVISKTARSDAKPATFDISPLADIIARLAAIPADQRIGPVILRLNGTPYDRHDYADAWRKYADAASLPKEIQCRDLRAGAINDALAKGASPLQAQHAARHASFDTTQIYIRGRDTSAAQVIELRARTSAQQG